MIQLPIQMPNLATFRESLDRAIAAENLRAVASRTADPSVLLGLLVLARPGDPVRRELAQLAVRARGEYEPMVALLWVMLEAIDGQSVSELIRADPHNALGHYLQGALHYISNRDEEALAEFKTGAAAELRTYDAITGQALFHALDALELRDLDRLCALSWATTRWANFSSLGIQPLYQVMGELARREEAARAGLAEILLSFAGQLFETNFINRIFALRAAEAAFIFKAEQPSEAPARRQGYAAAVYGLVSPLFACPGIKEWWHHTPQQLAHFLPGRIHSAFAAADPSLITSTYGQENLAVDEDDRAKMEAAKANALQAAKKLLEVALVDSDAIFGAYLKGLPRVTRPAGTGPVFDWTPVENLMTRRPDLFQAAAQNEKAMAALWQAGENSPSRKNAGRMMQIAWALEAYAQKHEQKYPASLEALFQSGELPPAVEVKSLQTGRRYVYVAAGEKRPSKANERTRFILFYDDEPRAGAWYDCAFASCLCNRLREADLQEHLRRRARPAE